MIHTLQTYIFSLQSDLFIVIVIVVKGAQCAVRCRFGASPGLRHRRTAHSMRHSFGLRRKARSTGKECLIKAFQKNGVIFILAIRYYIFSW